MQALRNFNTPQYLMCIVVSYHSDRALVYDTEERQKQYQVTGGVYKDQFLDHSCGIKYTMGDEEISWDMLMILSSSLLETSGGGACFLELDYPS